MSSGERAKVSVTSLHQKKKLGQQITMLTAYDYPMAQIIDRAGVDIIFVSDSLAMVGLGQPSTLPTTMDEMLHHTRAVARGCKYAFLLGCMPFMDYNTPEDARHNARRFLKEGGADGVEMEGGWEMLEAVEAVVSAGVPVMAHIGLTRQFVSKYGKFTVLGRTAADAQDLVNLAVKLQDIGVAFVSVETIPEKVARIITETLQIPVIGIGAGRFCDGQALVTLDLLGLFEAFTPKFVRQYANLWGETLGAFQSFKEDVERFRFPAPEHTFGMPEDEFELLKRNLRAKDYVVSEDG
ncbi:MAG: 3-methyl-2-oxobutanoate hydroxymethyltransferase [Thermoleophilia bacterium]|nr:3-methyl-2-oxobutanoate hydroxymethyltransferase [Thermoleophilia bacterium]